MRLLAAVVLCVVPSAWGAAIIGSTVTGDLNFGNPTIYYDPGNGIVPGSGYLNSSGNKNSPTVVINAGLPTFGFNDTANLDVADFSSGTQLVFTDLADLKEGGTVPSLKRLQTRRSPPSPFPRTTSRA